MRSTLLTLGIILLANTVVSAQKIDSTASVAWQRYKVSPPKVSWLMPKMPVVYETPSICGETAAVSFIAFAEGQIYEVTLAGPRRSVTQVNCGGKIISYHPKQLDERLKEIRESDKYKERSVRVGSADATLFTSERAMRWVLPNATTPARWIEVAIVNYPYDKVRDPDRVVDSLQLSADEGIEIGDGSPVMLGDSGVTSSVAAESLYLGRTTSPLTLYKRPTDFVTTKIPTGEKPMMVTLEIEFLANGSIGRIRPEKKLTNGLNEAAIEIARKISFLPKRRNGLATDSIETIIYRFTAR